MGIVLLFCFGCRGFESCDYSSRGLDGCEGWLVGWVS